MKYLTITTFLLLFVGQSWSSSIYKCESADGKVFFQDTACAKDHTTTMKKEVNSKLDKNRLSRKEKFYLDTYTLFMQSKTMLPSCKAKGASNSDDLKFRLERYKEIARYDIEAGEELANNGTENVSSTVLKNYVHKKTKKTDSDIRALNGQEANRLCGIVASKLAIAASQTTNRASGYHEGDLDPEGND